MRPVYLSICLWTKPTEHCCALLSGPFITPNQADEYVMCTKHACLKQQRMELTTKRSNSQASASTSSHPYVSSSKQRIKRTSNEGIDQMQYSRPGPTHSSSSVSSLKRHKIEHTERSISIVYDAKQFLYPAHPKGKSQWALLFHGKNPLYYITPPFMRLAIKYFVWELSTPE